MERAVSAAHHRRRPRSRVAPPAVSRALGADRTTHRATRAFRGIDEGQRRLT
jgi:hypothetical protein